MQNSHSDQPEENFRALYEKEINTQQIADSIAQWHHINKRLILRFSILFSGGAYSVQAIRASLSKCSSSSTEIFDKQTRSVLDQSVKMAVPKNKYN